MKINDIFSMNALQLSQGFGEGSISPSEVTELCLKEPLNSLVRYTLKSQRSGHLVKLVHLLKDGQSPISCLDGVPIAWKDLIDMEER